MTAITMFFFFLYSTTAHALVLFIVSLILTQTGKDHNEPFLVLASDGLWDVLSDDQVTSIVQRVSKKGQEDGNGTRYFSSVSWVGGKVKRHLCIRWLSTCSLYVVVVGTEARASRYIVRGTLRAKHSRNDAPARSLPIATGNESILLNVV